MSPTASTALPLSLALAAALLSGPARSAPAQDADLDALERRLEKAEKAPAPPPAAKKAAAAPAAPAGIVGTWHGALDGETFVADLRGDGTGTIDGDAVRWELQGNQLVVQYPDEALAYQVEVKGDAYPMELRNHPKTRDPMICLDGDCYVTQFQKPSW